MKNKVILLLITTLMVSGNALGQRKQTENTDAKKEINKKPFEMREGKGRHLPAPQPSRGPRMMGERRMMGNPRMEMHHPFEMNAPFNFPRHEAPNFHNRHEPKGEFNGQHRPRPNGRFNDRNRPKPTDKEKSNDKKRTSKSKESASFVSFSKVTIDQFVSIDRGISNRVESREMKSFSELGMRQGVVKYSTILPEIKAQSQLTLRSEHNYVQVYLNGAYIGKLDRMSRENSLTLPSVKEGDVLVILTEVRGRANFNRGNRGPQREINKVLITTEVNGHTTTYDLNNWEIATISDDYQTALNAFEGPMTLEMRHDMLASQSGYYRGYFNLKKVGNTYINVEAWGRGQVYINGHSVGHFVKGPQQTLYVPEKYLKKGENEIIIRDIKGTDNPTIEGKEER